MIGMALHFRTRNEAWEGEEPLSAVKKGLRKRKAINKGNDIHGIVRPDVSRVCS